MNAQLGLEGRYKFTKHKADADGNVIPGTEQLVLDWFENVITDIGLDSQAGYADQLTYCRLGTGNTAPAFTDTNLVAQVGSTNAAGLGGAVGVAGDSSYVYRRVSKRFPAGSAANVNLAEVGMSASATGANLFSRSLLKDTSGNPTTITLAPDEVLDVVYELRLYITNADVVVAATIDGAAANVTMRPHGWPNGWNQFGQFNNIGLGLLPPTADFFADQPAAATVIGNLPYSAPEPTAYNAYVPGSYTRTRTFNVGLDSANFAGGLGSVYIGGLNSSPVYYAGAIGFWSWGFSPKLNKTNSRTATITVGFTWGRYTP